MYVVDVTASPVARPPPRAQNAPDLWSKPMQRLDDPAGRHARNEAVSSASGFRSEATRATFSPRQPTDG
jgi:hypothetical protein